MDKFLTNQKWHQIILVVLALLLYSNTIQHDFVLDDNIVLKKNEYVKKGFSGISDILGNDSFKGFFLNDKNGISVTGGRYRPFTLVLFAGLYPIFGLNPMYYHLLTIILFAILGLVIYRFLNYSLSNKFKEQAIPISFLSALLFIVHPIHTEVVNNVKSIDEIISLLAALLGTYWILKYYDQSGIKYLILSFIGYCISIFSKESTVNFLFLVPATFLITRDWQWRKSLVGFSSLILATLVYAGVRIAVIGTKVFDDISRDVLLNPFMKIRGLSLTEASWNEKLGMIFACLGKYIKLFLIPYPLTHDYFPQHASLQAFGNPSSLIPFIVLLGLIIYSLVIRKSKPILSYSLWFMIVPLIFVSNLVVPMGVPMAERFAFTSSLGFTMFISYLLVHYLSTKNNILLAVVAILSLIFAYLTIIRNNDWKNEYSLFSHDVEISKNSIKAHSEFSYHLVEKIKSAPDSMTNRALVDEAIPHLEKTVQLYPRHANALYLLGNLNYLKKDYEKASTAYDKYLDLNPSSSDVLKNLQICYREYGRELAIKETEEDADKAVDLLIKSFKLKPTDARVLESLGMAYATKKEFTTAIDYFNKAAQLDPNNGMILVNLGNTYHKMGDKATGSKYIKEAYKVDKNIGAKLLNMQRPTLQ